jgi:hypothetical protein
MLKMIVFYDVTACSLGEVYLRFRGDYWLHHQGDLMMEAVRMSETSVGLNEHTRRNIQENISFYTRRHEVLKPHLFKC